MNAYNTKSKMIIREQSAEVLLNNLANNVPELLIDI
jgi:hypothetical protein